MFLRVLSEADGVPLGLTVWRRHAIGGGEE